MDKRIKQLVSKIKCEAANEQEAVQAEQQMKRLWELSAQYKQSNQPAFDTEKNLARLKKRMQQERAPSQSRHLVWLRVAASLLFLLLGTWAINAYFFSDKTLETFYNQGQSVATISLSDGSSVQVYPGSKLIYPARFSRKAARETQLIGTAYFKVQADVAHPFIIQTENTQVKVVGTAFLLKAEPEASETSIKVEEGKVYFQDKATELELLIPAHQIGICQPDGILFQEPQILEGALLVELRDQPLARLFAQIERHHQWKVELQQDIRQCRLTGTFNISDPEKILRQINGFSSFNVSKIEEGTYRISGSCP